MKGLLYKDWVTLYKTKILLIYVPMSIILSLAATDNGSIGFFPAFFAGMLPMTLYSHDERARWLLYAQSLPIKRSHLVSAKYTIGALLVIGFSGISCITQTIVSAILSSFDWQASVSLFLVMIALGSVGTSLLMPFIFRFGSEKGRLFYLATFALFGACSAIFFGYHGMDYSVGQHVPVPMAVVIALMGAVLFALSWGISILLFRNREL